MTSLILKSVSSFIKSSQIKNLEYSLNKEREATDAIKTVNAKYNYAPEYSHIRKQVGAVIASLNGNIKEKKEAVKEEFNDKPENILNIRKKMERFLKKSLSGFRNFYHVSGKRRIE